MVFQEPMTSLNPVLTVGRQLTETLEQHLDMSHEKATRARDRAAGHGRHFRSRRAGSSSIRITLSGGMRQRVMIAMALCCEPKLIIADEPTTALDVTIQAQILELMKDLTRRLGVALIVITHNLGIVARYADRVNVMYAGRIIESGTRRRNLPPPAPPLHAGAAEVGAAHGPAAQRPARSGAGPAARSLPARRQAARSVRAAISPSARCAVERPTLERSASKATSRPAGRRRKWPDR